MFGTQIYHFQTENNDQEQWISKWRHVNTAIQVHYRTIPAASRWKIFFADAQRRVKISVLKNRNGKIPSIFPYSFLCWCYFFRKLPSCIRKLDSSTAIWSLSYTVAIAMGAAILVYPTQQRALHFRFRFCVMIHCRRVRARWVAILMPKTTNIFSIVRTTNARFLMCYGGKTITIRFEVSVLFIPNFSSATR